MNARRKNIHSIQNMQFTNQLSFTDIILVEYQWCTYMSTYDVYGGTR